MYMKQWRRNGGKNPTQRRLMYSAVFVGIEEEEEEDKRDNVIRYLNQTLIKKEIVKEVVEAICVQSSWKRLVNRSHAGIKCISSPG